MAPYSLVLFFMSGYICINEYSITAASAKPQQVIVHKKFKWSYSLDTATGKASACETSSFLSSFAIGGNKRKIDDGENKGKVSKSMMSDLFEVYPEWLSYKRVSFGLLKTIIKNKNDGDSSYITSTISDSLIGLPILTFGQMRYVSSNIVEFPVIGGLLSFSSERKRNKKEENGCIRFTLSSTTSKVNSNNEKNLELKSQVLDYCPTISGAAPVSTFRKYLYLYTQPLVHAYVMKKYHEKCYNQLISNSQMK